MAMNELQDLLLVSATSPMYMIAGPLARSTNPVRTRPTSTDRPGVKALLRFLKSFNLKK